MEDKARNSLVLLLKFSYFSSLLSVTLGMIYYILVLRLAIWLDDVGIRIACYCILISVCILYSNLAMTVIARGSENQLYLSFVAVSYGVLYPLAAIGLVASSIYLTVEVPAVRPLSLLGLLPGGLMLLFYAGLRVFDYQSVANSEAQKKETRNHKMKMTNTKPSVLTHNYYHYKVQ